MHRGSVPNFARFGRLKPQNPLPGLDLSGLIRGQIQELDREGILLEFVSEHRTHAVFHDEVWRGIRSKRFKYTVKGNKFGGKPWQFFDLNKDPYEMNNLIDEQNSHDEIAYHHDLLHQSLRETEDPFVLLPAYGNEGYNLWNKEPTSRP